MSEGELSGLTRGRFRLPNRRARFLREARAAAAIRHPGIAVVYDIAELDGRVLSIMEYVDGESLRALVELPARARSQTHPPERTRSKSPRKPQRTYAPDALE